MLFLRLFLITILIPGFLFAEEGRSIQGEIHNKADGNKVPDVNVFNVTQSEGAVSDHKGQFSGLPFEKGDTLRFTHISYQTLEIVPDNHHIEVSLTPSAIEYSGVSIRGLEDYSPAFEAPVSASYISSSEIERHDNSSLHSVISSDPGVRMEERASGSYRISIRGSQLRAPFGVRNVKVYWNGIPFTEPGGSTHLNLIDFNLIDNIEILRGPAGSTYGGGTGGVLMLESKADKLGSSSINLGTRVGSYGQYSSSITANVIDDNARHQIKGAYRTSDGYRDHNALDRVSLNYSGNWDISDQQNLGILANFTDYYYEIPGGLTESQKEEDRQQSRPDSDFTDYNNSSKAQEASIHMENYLIGGNHSITTESFENRLSLGWQFRFFDHPFNINYKRHTEQHFSARNRSSYQWERDNGDIELSWGGEVQRGLMSRRQYGNAGGTPDTVQFDDEIYSLNSMAFIQLESDLFWGINARGGFSLNHQQHRLLRLSEAPADPDGFEKKYSFDEVLDSRLGVSNVFIAPRLAFSRTFRDDYNAFLSVQEGFSPPTLEEIRTPEGTFNEELRPERGINVEGGFRYKNPLTGLSWEVSVFDFRLQNTIVSYPSEEESEVFRNSGETSQRGIETGLTWQAKEAPNSHLSALDFDFNYTYNHFFFEEYEVLEGDELEDFSGNRLTGVPPHSFYLGIHGEFFDFWQINLSGRYVDMIPLNDYAKDHENAVYSDDYLKADLKSTVSFSLTNDYELDIYGGVNNFLNEEYGLGNDLNPYGGRYFQPSPSRNYYGGLEISREF